MKLTKRPLLAGVLLLFAATANCFGGPPLTGSRSADAKWYNPTEWQMPALPQLPALPWGGERPRIRKKSQGVVTDMNQSVRRGWAKTKSALNPSQLFVSDPKPSKSEPGFWQSLFGPANDPQDVRTANDFLGQPRPR